MTGLRTAFLLTTAIGSTSLIASAASAQEIFTLDEITVSANREETALSRSGATVEVVTEEEIERGAATLAKSYIERLPGVSMRSYGPPGASVELRLRGAPSHYTAVKIDGIEVNDPSGTQGGYDFGSLAGSGLSRIEVLKGGNSALYGSNAIAGAINVTSWRPTELGTQQQLGLEFGSYATRKFNYSVGTKSEAGLVSLSYAHVSSNGFSSADENDGNFEADGFRSNRLSFALEHDFNNGLRMGANAFVDDSWSAYDDGSDLTGTLGNDFWNRRTQGLRVFGEYATGLIDHKLELSFYEADREGCDDYYRAYTCTPYNGTRKKLSYSAAFDIGAQGRAVLGAETERNDARFADINTGAPFSGDVRKNAVFGELNWALTDRVDLTASLRYDDHSDFGSFTSGRLAAVYRLRDDLVLRGSLSNNFRAPSLYELYGPYGNPAMQREELLSADLGIEKTYGDKGRVRLTAFWLDAENLIGWDFGATYCGSGFGCYNQVPGTSRRRGVELSGSYALSERLTVGGSYTYTDNAASTNWADVERHNLSLFADYALTDTLSLGYAMQHVADRSSGFDDYTVADLTLAYEVNEQTEAYLRVENLFDEEYQLYRGYGTSDRALYVGLRASF